MCAYRNRNPLAYSLYRWGIHFLIGGLILTVWFLFVMAFISNPRLIVAAVGLAATIYIIIKTYKKRRLIRAINAVERDPVNPDSYFDLARAYYFRSIFTRSRSDKLEAVKALRNAVQLDLDLDIRRPVHTTAALLGRYGYGSRTVHFIRIFTLYATVDYLFEEYERYGLPSEDIFLGKSRLFQFDRRQLQHIISSYELRLRELEALRVDVQNSGFSGHSLDGAVGDVFATQKRQLDLLISFIKEVTSHLRKLYREYQLL